LPSHILLLGHRGARHYAPENTIAAFDLALEHGARGFEFDLRCTRNREIVICHDPRWNRLPIRRHTLKQLAANGAEAPACLEHVLERYSHTAFLNLEVKVRGAERLVYQLLRSFRPQRGYLISSFRPGVLREFHRLNPSLVLGTLSQTRWQLRRWHKLPVAYVLPQYHLLSRRLIEEIHAANKLVVTWTVNRAKQMLRAVELGVDGIISDDTKLLADTLSHLARK
jgi:glycerophosphoryl diester phosphodiesterase